MENDLLVLLRQCLQGEPVVGRSSQARILSHHLRQVERIVELCAERQRALPCPARFREVEPSRREVQMEEAGFADETPGLLADLLDRNLELAGGLRLLVAGEREVPRPNPLLSEALQRHLNLAAMLRTLLEEKGPEVLAQPLSLGDSPSVRCRLEHTADRPENEGDARDRPTGDNVAGGPGNSVPLQG